MLKFRENTDENNILHNYICLYGNPDGNYFMVYYIWKLLNFL